MTADEKITELQMILEHQSIENRKLEIEND
jgi:hypothetical protein